MKIEFSFLKKINFGGSLTRGRRKLIHTLVNPAREWSVSLLATLLVAVGLFAFAGVNFYQQYNDSNKPVVSEEHIPKYREQDAELLIRYHVGRREVFESLRNERPARPSNQEVVEPEATSQSEGEPNLGVAGDIVAE